MLLAAVALAGCGDATDGLGVGDKAPDFTLPTASGGTASLDDYAGPALLYFHMADG
jgi:peroxiredoxin